jgi:hypothetical protein
MPKKVKKTQPVVKKHFHLSHSVYPFINVNDIDLKGVRRAGNKHK